MIDTLSIMERLTKAGLAEEHAKAIAHEFGTNNDQLATKDDIKGVRADINGLRWLIGALLVMNVAVVLKAFEII